MISLGSSMRVEISRCDDVVSVEDVGVLHLSLSAENELSVWAQAEAEYIFEDAFSRNG